MLLKFACKSAADEGLVGLAVFVFVLVVEHREIALITALGDVVVFDGFEDSAARFVGVGTVGEAALFGELEYLLEIAGQLLALHIEGAEPLNARGVNKPGGFTVYGFTIYYLERNHLREGRGVHTCLVGIADVGYAQVGMWC